MNRFELLFSAVRVPVDFVLIILAGFLSYQIRISSFAVEARPILYDLSNSWYNAFVLVFAMITIVILAFSGMYITRRTRTIVIEFYRILSSVSTTILIIILYYFFYSRDIFSSRFLIISIWVLSITLLLLGRITLHLIQDYITKHYKWGVHRVAIITGSDIAGKLVLDALNTKAGFSYQIVEIQKELNLKNLRHLIITKQIDEVILADTNLEQEKLIKVNYLCEEYKIDFQYVPNIFDMYTQVEIKNLSGVLLFRVKRTTLEGWGSIYKRIFDIVVASLAIIILSPIYILTIIAIKLDSPGPILYKNKRVGVAKKMFNVYKFRSMYQDMCTDETNTASIELEQKLLAEKNTKSGPLYKIKDDPRVTKLGKFIRKTSIDELPQFFNVLQGTMSLVGPRPHQPREVDKYKQHHKKVLTIKPGITGMAQINGRSDLSFEEEVLYDTFYIENWSIWLDIIILLKTPWAVIAPRKAD
jgi:exopolysaccharide biosynthesis polyprenyl glycosylphosphotransferase